MKLHLDDRFLTILFENEVEKTELDAFLTYQDMSKAYSGGGFDSRRIKKVHFLKKVKQYYVCFIGFLYEVIKFAKENSLVITEIKDDRTKFEHNKKEYEYKELRSYFNPDFKYVEHQIKILKAALKTNTGIFKASTSAGKTSTFIAIIKAIKLPTLILVNKITLATQTRDRLEEEGLQCGLVTGNSLIIKENVVATIGSVKKVPDLHKYKILIIDETHNASAATFQDFLSHVSFPIRFGFSATPEGNDKLKFAKIRQFLGSILVEIEAKELMENDVIVKPKITFIEVECPKTLDWTSAYLQGIVYNEERNKKIKKLTQKYIVPTLILVASIEHGQILNKMIDESCFISGVNKEDERNKAIKDFITGKIKVLIASTIFDEGISINEIRMLIIASGQKSSIKICQRIGRSLRKSNGKSSALVFDFYDLGNRFLTKHSIMRHNVYKKIGFEV